MDNNISVTIDRSKRINTNLSEDIEVKVNLTQDIDNLEILSLKIGTENLYKLHTSKYGCICGRVLANDAVGIPNAKISVFVKATDEWLEDEILTQLYPYTSVSTKDEDNIRYNTLPDNKVNSCYTIVGTFPNKRLVLDDDNVIEVYDSYYKYTTRTNGSGDYMIFGVPVDTVTLHTDIDLSDIGYLSQKPYDMVYKGYIINQFENANKFKSGTNLDDLAQVISQDTVVDVKPFWGEEEETYEATITRQDISINYQFTPTCVFIGSIVTDEKSNGVSERCIPTERMGKMDRLTTGAGTIEMIRKTQQGTIESFEIQGNNLIDGDGTWCYQIPMNLDYVKTDEYGNLVPAEDSTKGIPTRACVRFRISYLDNESDGSRNHVAKVLVPNNPKKENDLDYNFGSLTNDSSFKDLFWNNVYSVKSYIPRIQKGNFNRNRRFTGFKTVNVNGSNNPLPYNNLRIRITFMFVLQCAIIKALLWITKCVNWFYGVWFIARRTERYLTLGDGICPDLEGWYFAPGAKADGKGASGKQRRKLWRQTFNILRGETEDGDSKAVDTKSIDYNNSEEETVCLTNQTDYLINCVEINLALEYEVISFDFYNDWLNGLIYVPHWFAKIKNRHTFLFGSRKKKNKKILYCGENGGKSYSRRLVEQCALSYTDKDGDGYYTDVTTVTGCKKENKLRCHRAKGRKHYKVFNDGRGALVHSQETMKSENVYYFKPCEWHDNGDTDIERRAIMFATDIILLGSLNDCDKNGIPKAFEQMPTSSYLMPTNLASTNMDGEGKMFGTSNGSSICNNTKLDGEGATEISAQTFSNYLKWSKKTEWYEKQPDDITEYAVTETAGIDWGYTGPNQNGSGDDPLYNPGGHFLGISCVNGETSIKSCVNLKRVCEVGSELSSRDYIVVKSGETFDYVYITPTGLISKDELTGNSFREMFATMNVNNLETEINPETNYKRYKFISLVPTNFNGELNHRIIDNENYNTGTAYHDNQEKEGKDKLENPDAWAIRRTFEYRSNDYYRYRFGETSKVLDKTIIKKHYLIEDGNTVALPMYENSYYFYFGLKDGNTALDKFFEKYYANCDETDEDPSYFKLETEDASYCSGEDGKLKVTVNNVSTPITVTITKNNVIQYFSGYTESNDGYSAVTMSSNEVYKKWSGDTYIFSSVTNGDKDFILSDELIGYPGHDDTFTICNFEGNDDGVKYGITLTDADDISQTVSLTFHKKLPDRIQNINISSSSFDYEIPNIDYKDLWAMNYSGQCGGYIQITNYYNLWKGIEDKNKNKGLVGFEVSTNDGYTYYTNNNISAATYIIETYDDKGEVEKYIYEGKFNGGEPVLSNNTLTIGVWKANDTFYVKGIYDCGDEKYSKIELAHFEITDDSPMDIYIGDSDLTYNKTIKKLIESGWTSYDSFNQSAICTNENWYDLLLSFFIDTEARSLGKTYFYKDKNNRWSCTYQNSPGFHTPYILITPKMIWNLKKALYYQDSLYDTNTTGRILVGGYGGNGFYKECIIGTPEKLDTSKEIANIILKENGSAMTQYYYDKSGKYDEDSVTNISTVSGFELSLSNILCPTKKLQWCELYSQLYTTNLNTQENFVYNDELYSNYAYLNNTDSNLLVMRQDSKTDKNGNPCYPVKFDYNYILYSSDGKERIPSNSALTLPSIYMPFYFNCSLFLDDYTVTETSSMTNVTVTTNPTYYLTYRIANGITYNGKLNNVELKINDDTIISGETSYEEQYSGLYNAFADGDIFSGSTSPEDRHFTRFLTTYKNGKLTTARSYDITFTVEEGHPDDTEIEYKEISENITVKFPTLDDPNDSGNIAYFAVGGGGGSYSIFNVKTDNYNSAGDSNLKFSGIFTFAYKNSTNFLGTMDIFDDTVYSDVFEQYSGRTTLIKSKAIFTTMQGDEFDDTLSVRTTYPIKIYAVCDKFTNDPDFMSDLQTYNGEFLEKQATDSNAKRNDSLERLNYNRFSYINKHSNQFCVAKSYTYKDFRKILEARYWGKCTDENDGGTPINRGGGRLTDKGDSKY